MTGPKRAVELLVAAAFLTCSVAAAARQSDAMNVERLATCQDSWFDWKDNPAQMNRLSASFQSAFSHKQGDAFVVPKKRMTIAGLRVQRVFPESIGMAVGFSVIVDAKFDESRKVVEKAIGKQLEHCETSENMRNCELQVAEKRTIALMAEDSGKSKTTLIGCYYFYAK